MKKTLFSCLLIILSLTIANAHPHLFIETACSLEFREGNLRGLWVEFLFDEYFSSGVLLDYDRDGDGFIDVAETQEVHDNAFINLENYNFFTFLRYEGGMYLPEKAESFSVRCASGDRLIYDFFIPLLDFPYRDFYVAIYDDTFFCDVRYREDFFSVRGTGIPDYSAGKEINENFTVYYNPLGTADDDSAYDSWSLGLLTFIPEEIHFRY